jgi:hypothetical protein
MLAAPAPPSSALPLLRRWVVDYFNRHDDEAARAFIAPDYSLHIGDVIFAGRDDSWLPAVAEQMRLFPGLGMTVHQTLAGPNCAAAWFSEHGASNGRVAVWSGVAIYFSDGERLTRCVAQEDYATRQRQLKSGVADGVDPPAAAPWDVLPLCSDSAAEAVARNWLTRSWPTSSEYVRCDDEHITHAPLRFEVRDVEIDTLFSSGTDVAFHAQQTGVYLDGLPGVEPAGRQARMQLNGILHIADGHVSSGRVIRDRIGLRAALRGERKS